MKSAPQRTAEEAKAFTHYSEANAQALKDVAAMQGCTCIPYRDWFTFNRWAAQGYHVRRGQHGIKLHTFLDVTETDDNGEKKVTGKRPKTYTVFCRCQVEKDKPQP